MPNALPTGALTATPATAAPGQAVTLDASSFKDPDSLITGYDWDFDGNGTVDRSTTAPTTSFAYASAGTFTPEGRGEGLPRRHGDGLDERDGGDQAADHADRAAEDHAGQVRQEGQLHAPRQVRGAVQAERQAHGLDGRWRARWAASG